jgi:hypothetical protein
MGTPPRLIFDVKTPHVYKRVWKHSMYAVILWVCLNTSNARTVHAVSWRVTNPGTFPERALGTWTNNRHTSEGSSTPG